MIIAMGTPLGDRIVALRAQRGWTQGQLAAFSRVKRSWLSLVETGERRRPNAEMLARVAHALGTTLEYLVTGKDSAQTNDEVTIRVKADRAAALRRLAQYPPDLVNRFERAMAGFFLSGDLDELPEPAGGEPARSVDGDQHEQEPPDPPANR